MGLFVTSSLWFLAYSLNLKLEVICFLECCLIFRGLHGVIPQETKLFFRNIFDLKMSLFCICKIYAVVVVQ
jgi:hypothetical protein